MKKVCVIVLMMIVLVLSACSEKMYSVSGISIEEFNIVHADDDYTIWKRLGADDGFGVTLSYPSPVYDFSTETCTARYGDVDWLLEYDGDFYHIGEGFKINLYDPHELEEYGIIFTCIDK
ncbi:MAG: hypothetical protein QM489_02960 [Candidatus Izemoplasma sp.]